MNGSVSQLSFLDRSLIRYFGPKDVDRDLMSSNVHYVGLVRNYSASNAKSRAVLALKISVMLIALGATIKTGYSSVLAGRLKDPSHNQKLAIYVVTCVVSMAAIIGMDRFQNPYSPLRLANQASDCMREGKEDEALNLLKQGGGLASLQRSCAIQNGCVKAIQFFHQCGLLDEHYVEQAVQTGNETALECLRDLGLLKMQHVECAHTFERFETAISALCFDFAEDGWEVVDFSKIRLNRFFAHYFSIPIQQNQSMKTELEELLVFVTMSSARLCLPADASEPLRQLNGVLKEMQADRNVDINKPETYKSYFKKLSEIEITAQDCNALIAALLLQDA